MIINKSKGSVSKNRIAFCISALVFALSTSAAFSGQVPEKTITADQEDETDADACKTARDESGSYAVAHGTAARATNLGGVAVGGCTRALADGASAVGYRAEAKAQNATAIGQHSKAYSVESLAVGSGAVVDRNAAYSMAIGSGAYVGSGATNAMAIGAGAKASNKDSVALGANSTTSDTVATNSQVINGVTYEFAGSTPEGSVSIGRKGKERTLTNLAAGRISEDSTDGVNGSQLYATNQAITLVNNRFNTFGNDVASIFGGGAGFNGDGSIRPPTYEFGDKKYNDFSSIFNDIDKDNKSLHNEINDMKNRPDDSVTYDPNPDGTSSNNVTLAGGDPNAPVAIHNVADGKQDADAINLGQLNKVAADANSYTDKKADETLQNSKSYTDSAIKDMNQRTDEQMSMLSGRVDDVQKEARQAAAVGLAASSLRYDDRPGKLSAAIGGGAWQGEGAFAAGLGYTSENQRIRLNISAANAGQHWGMGGGVSYTFN